MGDGRETWSWVPSSGFRFVGASVSGFGLDWGSRFGVLGFLGFSC